MMITERDQRLILASVVPRQPLLRNQCVHTFSEDGLLVQEKFLVRLIFVIDVGVRFSEARRWHLLAVADNHHRAATTHSADGIGNSYLRGFVEDDNVEEV